jgi:Flp pilus assembly protein TadG
MEWRHLSSRRAGEQTQKGATVVEFAVLLPVLMAMLLGTCVFGVGTYYKSVVTYAAREGVRWASVRGSSNKNQVATPETVKTIVESHAPGLRPLTVTTTWVPDTKAPGSKVHIDASYNYRLNLPFVSARTYVLSTSAEMVVVR